MGFGIEHPGLFKQQPDQFEGAFFSIGWREISDLFFEQRLSCRVDIGINGLEKQVRLLAFRRGSIPDDLRHFPAGRADFVGEVITRFDLLSGQKVIAHHVQKAFFDFGLVFMLDAVEVVGECRPIGGRHGISLQIRNRISGNIFQLQVWKSSSGSATYKKDGEGKRSSHAL